MLNCSVTVCHLHTQVRRQCPDCLVRSRIFYCIFSQMSFSGVEFTLLVNSRLWCRLGSPSTNTLLAHGLRILARSRIPSAIWWGSELKWIRRRNSNIHDWREWWSRTFFRVLRRRIYFDFFLRAVTARSRHLCLGYWLVSQKWDVCYRVLFERLYTAFTSGGTIAFTSGGTFGSFSFGWRSTTAAFAGTNYRNF